MVCEPGTVEVPSLMAVESYENVHQLVSTVRGRLRDDVSDPRRAARAVPGGLDDRRAQAAARWRSSPRSSRRPRSAYAGAFGWIAGDGRADLGVVIRSLFTAGDGELDARHRRRHHRALAASTEEYAETVWKADRLRAVFDD